MASSVSAEWPAPEQMLQGALVMAGDRRKFLEALGHAVATEVGSGELRGMAARLEPMQPEHKFLGRGDGGGSLERRLESKDRPVFRAERAWRIDS